MAIIRVLGSIPGSRREREAAIYGEDGLFLLTVAF
jgi:hypothetical protein